MSVAPLSVSRETLHTLEEHLLLFFTGYSRSAGSILVDQRRRSDAGERAMIANLEETKALGRRIRDALQEDRPAEFGALMDEHWQRKRARSEGMSNDDIDRWYQAGLSAGALGGKLVGAGTGGFLMFYAEDASELRAEMARLGLRETRFAFDLDGSTVIVRD